MVEDAIEDTDESNLQRVYQWRPSLLVPYHVTVNDLQSSTVTENRPAGLMLEMEFLVAHIEVLDCCIPKWGTMTIPHNFRQVCCQYKQ